MEASRRALILLFLRSLLLTGCFGFDPDFLQDFCVADLEDAIQVNGFLCKDTARVTSADFVFSGFRNTSAAAATVAKNGAVAATMASVSQFPGLNAQGMAMVKAEFGPGGVNPPHFHPRSSELVYVVEGSVYAGFVTTSNVVYAAVLHKGDLFVVPKGLVHFQMGLGDANSIVLGAFNSQNPGFQGLPNTLFGAGINDQVLLKAFDMSHGTLQSLKAKFKH